MTTATDNTLSALDTPSPASTDHIVVKCAQLSKIFRDFWYRPRVRAVSDIDLEIYRGEVFGLLGPNGSGKSTTIKMILGLLHQTSGRIAVFGKLPHDVATKRRIGYLPEESYLYRFLNARETLDYYGRLFHQHRPTRQKRIDDLLEMVGLDAVQRRPLGEYSKGMQRRIGLAQALINDPELLILDEPTTGLDPLGTRQIKDLILQLRQRGKTILLCSHLLADVEDVCDRVSIMFGGKVRAEGTVDELLTRQDMTTIQTASLDTETIEAVEQTLAAHGHAIEKVERPRQRLEALFLEIVETAQREGVETSGARGAGDIAGFLVTGEAADEGDALIDRLVTGDSQEQPKAPDHREQASPSGSAHGAPTTGALTNQPESNADEQLISQLTSGQETTPRVDAAHTTTQPIPAPPPADDVDEEAIADLITDGWEWAAKRDQPKPETPQETDSEQEQAQADAPTMADDAATTDETVPDQHHEQIDEQIDEQIQDQIHEDEQAKQEPVAEVQTPSPSADDETKRDEIDLTPPIEEDSTPPRTPIDPVEPVDNEIKDEQDHHVDQGEDDSAAAPQQRDAEEHDKPKAPPNEQGETGSMFTQAMQEVSDGDEDQDDDDDGSNDSPQREQNESPPDEPRKPLQGESPDQSFLDALSDMQNVKRIDDEFDEHDPLGDRPR